MRKMFSAYPEIILIDATYKLNDLRLPLYVMMVEDGNGESEIVGLMLVADEQRDNIKQIMSYFKQNNPNWQSINCIMADKDMTERQVLKEELPQAGLLICLFHTMRSFRREVTTDKMGISSDERMQVLELLQSMAYAKSEDEYNKLYQQLMSTRFTAVKNYFNENWHPIREQWVEGLKNHFTNFLNSTNNRVESINQKFKTVVSRHSKLLEFHEYLQTCLFSLRMERNHRATTVFQKRPVSLHDVGPVELDYFNHLTPFAFKHISHQLSLSKKVGKFENSTASPDHYTIDTSKGTLTVSPENCHCDFASSMKLPCRHILSLRKQLNFPQYAESLCDKRWTKEYYLTCHRTFRPTTGNCYVPENNCQYDDSTDNAVSITVKKENPRERKVLSQHEIYRKVFGVAQKLASIASEETKGKFWSHLAVLQDILAASQQGKEVEIKETGTSLSDSEEMEIDTPHEQPWGCPATNEIGEKKMQITNEIPADANSEVENAVGAPAQEDSGTCYIKRGL